MTKEEFDNIIEDIMTSNWESGRTKIINLCKLMCDTQRDICYGHADCTDNFFEIDMRSITNAPYPEELL